MIIFRVTASFCRHFAHNEQSPSLFSHIAVDDSEERTEQQKTALLEKVPPLFMHCNVPNMRVLCAILRARDAAQLSTKTEAKLSNYYPAGLPAPPTCVRSIVYSGWNPVPGNRRLQGPPRSQESFQIF
jgi:hypothetical protein